jgi:hypothetical protein
VRRRAGAERECKRCGDKGLDHRGLQLGGEQRLLSTKSRMPGIKK